MLRAAVALRAWSLKITFVDVPDTALIGRTYRSTTVLRSLVAAATHWPVLFWRAKVLPLLVDSKSWKAMMSPALAVEAASRSQAATMMRFIATGTSVLVRVTDTLQSAIVLPTVASPDESCCPQSSFAFRLVTVASVRSAPEPLVAMAASPETAAAAMAMALAEREVSLPCASTAPPRLWEASPYLP